MEIDTQGKSSNSTGIWPRQEVQTQAGLLQIIHFAIIIIQKKMINRGILGYNLKIPPKNFYSEGKMILAHCVDAER